MLLRRTLWNALGRFWTLLLAEVEQVAHTDRQDQKSAAPEGKINEFRQKKYEEGEVDKNGGKAKGKGGGEGKTTPCRYFLK